MDINNTISVGSLLVATPKLDHTLFQRSVILLIEHSWRGTVGLCVNHSSDWGGPVPLQTTWNLHALDLACNDSIRINRSLAITPEKFSRDKTRSFDSCAAWRIGQLDRELDQLCWLPLQTSSETLLELTTEEVWPWACRQATLTATQSWMA
jgi:putative AlgH/UPF0301 family transcriptional regulator